MEIKDLITTGLFTAIYILQLCLISMTGVIPVLHFFLPAMAALFCSIPFFLFLARVRKFGMITLLGTLSGLFVFLIGHPWVALVSAIFFSVIADLICRAGHYKSSVFSAISYSVFSFWTGIFPATMWLMQPYYKKAMDAMYPGSDYTMRMFSLLNSRVLPFAIIIATFIGCLLGVYIGQRTIKRHFEKAGIA